jgi:hypothetical protein
MQDAEIVAGNLRLVENACGNVAGVGIQGKDEGLDEPFRETMYETKEKKGDGITSESDPEVLDKSLARVYTKSKPKVRTTDLRVIQQRPGMVNILVTLNAEDELGGVAGTGKNRRRKRKERKQGPVPGYALIKGAYCLLKVHQINL